MAGVADQADHQVTECGHDPRSGSGFDVGGVFTECDVADPVEPVLDGPMSADVGGQMVRGGLPGAEAGDPQHGDSGLDVDGLVSAAALGSFADLAGGVALEEEHLGCVGETQVGGSIHDLDGADFLAPVAGVHGAVRDCDAGPVQAVQPLEQARLELARNPFMLVILAWLHATGDAALTPVRGELIYQLVRSLLARESLRGHEAIDTATLSDFLGQAAWDLVESGDSSTFPVDSLLRHRRSRSGQRTMPGAKIDDTAAIRLACSASILEETTEGAFRFCHHVIQDYFTGAEMAKRFAAGQDLTGLWRLAASTVQAREASQGNSLAFERLSAGPWDEATIMASGLCGDIEEFLSTVNISNPILAGRCQLESNADISQQLRDEINRRLLATMVDSGQELPTRVLAGETVGLLGDPRFTVSTAANGVHYIKPPMVQVPGGQYLVGASPEDTDAFDNERPQHSVSVQPFVIGKYLVTVGEFSHFVEAGGYAERRYWATEEARAWLDGTEADTGALSQLMEFREEVLQSGKSVEDWATEWSRSPQWLSTWRRLTEMDADRARATLLEVYAEHSRKEPIWWSEPSISGGNQPVVGITWYEAEAYCSWLSDVAGGNYRLPTEIEWEVAARGESCTVYPWGDSFDHRLANTIEGGVPTTAPVGLYADGASLFGLFDLAGNSWEWTGSPHRQYPARLGDRISIQPGERRAVRGGCWYSNKRYARCSYRSGDHPDCYIYLIGFRVCSNAIAEQTSVKNAC